MSVDRVGESRAGGKHQGPSEQEGVSTCLQVFGLALHEPLKACSALFILMIMSSSICRHFSTFPFLKLIEQFNELKSFGRREKNTCPTIITVIKSGN